MGLVLDTSVVIAAERKRQPVAMFVEEAARSLGETEMAISVVTLAELVHGIARAKDDETRARRRGFIDELKRSLPVWPLTEQAAEIAGRISGEQAAVGVIIPFEDLFIAASALEQGYGVATGNVEDFQRVPGLRVVLSP